jgi:hypothetical protein
MTRASEAAFVANNVDMLTPARVAMPHQVSPGSTR